MPGKWKWIKWLWPWWSKKRDNNANESSTKHKNNPSIKQVEKILKELECPICFNTCTPPIYTCENGHIICSLCRQNVTNCPTCRERFSGTRNYFAEHFIGQYSQPCKFAKDGCPFLKWKGDDMKRHEKSCFYRPVSCIVPSCTTPVRYKYLLDHAINAHKVSGSDALPALVSYHKPDPLLSDQRWQPYYIKAFNCTFYLMMEIIRPHFWTWVWVQTPKKESANNNIFIASLKFQNEEKNLSLEWKGPVYAIRTTPSMMTQDGLCLGCAEGLLQHFEIDGLLWLQLNIEMRTLNVNNSGESSDISSKAKPDRGNRNAGRSVSIGTILPTNND